MTRKYINHPSKSNNHPVEEVNNGKHQVESGWEAICTKLNHEIKNLNGEKKMVVIETYQG